MGQELVLARQAAEIVADHLIRPLRRLAAGPKADEHTGDDGAVGLNLNAGLAVTEKLTAAQDLFEKPKEDFNRPAV